MTSSETINIALIGAPTSGKTELADALQAKLADQFPGIVVVDNLSQRLVDNGYEVSQEGDFRTSLMLTALQLDQERSAPSHSIVCGTLVQRLAEIGVKIDHIGNRVKRIPTATNKRALSIENIMGHLLAFVLAEEFQYHFMFYLPLKDSTDLYVPGDVESEEDYNKKIDASIRHILDAFFIPAVRLEYGEFEKQALEFIETAMKQVQETADAEVQDTTVSG